MIPLEKLFSITERVRKGAIGDPNWISAKEFYEYSEQSAKVVAVLKTVRAAQGVKSLQVLCHTGLFIDFGVIFRCVCDCENEVYFLLEDFPKSSPHVDQFVRAFFEGTIDGHLSKETEPVQIKKIRSAVVRVLHGQPQNEKTRSAMETVYKAFSGYVHADYAHIMETFGGKNFSLAGISSSELRSEHMQLVELASSSVLNSLSFIVQKLALVEFAKELSDCL